VEKGNEQLDPAEVAPGAVLVVGGGIVGLHAALALADAGAETIVVEQGPILGGKRAAWLAGEGDLDPRLAAVGDNAAIEVLTLTELTGLGGEAGDFSATILQRPRFVNDDCTRCNHCVPVCPEAVPNEYDAGLTFRKAIHSPLPETIPNIYAIDIDSCLNMPPNYLPCQRCVEACDDHAIHFDMLVPEPAERRVAAVILATGFADNDDAERATLEEFGYGQHPDVVSSVELQRLLEAPGPSGGYAIKPSDEAYPDSVMLVLTRVSAYTTWVMGNQLRRLAGQNIAQLTVLVLAPPGGGDELEDLAQTAASCGATLRWGNWIGVEPGEDQQLQVRYAELPSGRQHEQCVDLLALSSEAHADAGAEALAQILELERDEQGYLSPSRPGIYIVGGALGTVGIERGAEQAREAAQAALQHVELAGPEEQVEAPQDWGELPAAVQQQYLEKMLHSLVRLGGGS